MPPRIALEHAIPAAFAVVATLLGIVVMHMARVAEASTFAFLVGVVSHAAAGLLVGAAALRPPSGHASYILLVTSSMVAGAFAATATAAARFDREEIEDLMRLMDEHEQVNAAAWLAMRGAVGIVPGALVGGICAGFVSVLREERLVEGGDFPDRVTARVFGRAALLGGSSCMVLGGLELAVAAGATIAAAAVVLACGGRDAWRAAWLRRALSGESPRYAVISREEAPVGVDEIAPLVSVGGRDAVLVRVSEAGDPYRDARRAEPVARVAKRVTETLTALRHRAAMAFLTGLLALVLVGVAVYLWVRA